MEREPLSYVHCGESAAHLDVKRPFRIRGKCAFHLVSICGVFERGWGRGRRCIGLLAGEWPRVSEAVGWVVGLGAGGIRASIGVAKGS